MANQKLHSVYPGSKKSLERSVLFPTFTNLHAFSGMIRRGSVEQRGRVWITIFAEAWEEEEDAHPLHAHTKTKYPRCALRRNEKKAATINIKQI